MMRLDYTLRARRELHDLPQQTSLRIAMKLRWYADQELPLLFAKRLIVPGAMLFRFRIGHYRAIFRLEGRTLEIILILTVKHRKEAYQ